VEETPKPREEADDTTSNHISENGISEQSETNSSQKSTRTSNTQDGTESAPTKRKTETQKAGLDMKLIRGKSIVQLSLVEELNNIAFTHYSSLTTDHLVMLLDSLQSCYNFSRTSNNNTHLQKELIKSGLRDLLIRKETTTISCYLRVLFRMYGETLKDSENRIAVSEDRLIKMCSEILVTYIQQNQILQNNIQIPNTEIKRVATAYANIVVQILKGILDLYDAQFMKHLTLYYPLFCDLVLHDNKDIREQLRFAFLRVGIMKDIKT